MDYTEDLYATMQPMLIGILAVICMGVLIFSAAKVVAEHGSDNSRGGRSFMQDLGYALFVPAAGFGIGSIVLLIPQIREAFGI